MTEGTLGLQRCSRSADKEVGQCVAVGAPSLQEDSSSPEHTHETFVLAAVVPVVCICWQHLSH